MRALWLLFIYALKVIHVANIEGNVVDETCHMMPKEVEGENEVT